MAPVRRRRRWFGLTWNASSTVLDSRLRKRGPAKPCRRLKCWYKTRLPDHASCQVGIRCLEQEMIKIGHAAIGTNRQTKRSVASLATRKRGGNHEWTQRYVPILPMHGVLPCIEVFSSTWRSHSQILPEMRAKLKTRRG